MLQQLSDNFCCHNHPIAHLDKNSPPYTSCKIAHAGTLHSHVACHMQVVARCAISTTMGGCFGGTVGIIVQLIYTKVATGQAVW